MAVSVGKGLPSISTHVMKSKVSSILLPEHKQYEELIGFGLTFALSCGHLNMPIDEESKNRFFNQAIEEVLELGYSEEKIKKLVRRKMNKFKLGVEGYDDVRRLRR